MTNIEPPHQAPALPIDQTLRQAIAFHRAGQLQDAERLYRAILLAQPKHPEANHKLGILAMQMKQATAGLSHLMAALEADPARGQYWLSYIDALIQAEQMDAAREVLGIIKQRGLQGEEVDALAARLAGGAPVAEHTHAERRQTSNEAPPVAPATPQDNRKKPDAQEINTLVSQFNQGRFSEAASLAQAMTARFPLLGLGWKVLGAAFMQMGRSADALAPMQKAAALSPHDPDVHNNLGAILQDFGRFNEAESCIRQALQIKPDFTEAYNNLGNALKGLNRLDEAEACYRRALQVNPNYGEAHYNLGITLHDSGRLDEAEASYRQALKFIPDNAAAHSNLGNTLKELGRLDEAEASCRRALEINPDFAAAQGILNDIFRKKGLLPDYLAPEVFDFANGRSLRRYFPHEASTFIYSIDVSGTCNLRCPSCPVGNFPDALRSKGFMDLDLFRRIVEKIKQDRVVDNPKVWLFNWGEPLLHPKLPEMIAILKQNGLYAMISTNLSIKRNLEETIRAEPDEIKISLSGLTQAVYSKTHVKGDIELVKRNMGLIRDLIDKFNLSIRVWVGHHLYRHNIHESAAMEHLCRTLRFDYHSIPAFYSPLEKMVDLIEGRSDASETELLANLLVHPLDALALKRKTINKDLDCEMRFNMTAINHDGSVALCCGTYDSQNMLGVDFIDKSHAEIQQLKYRHPFCKKCYDYGLQYSEPLPVQ